MDKEYLQALSKIRLERAKELIDEANSLLKSNSYKSANNRAFYAMEKSIKSLLALKGQDNLTHNGAIKQFNYHYIYKGDGFFTANDYKIISSAEQIRNASDYDDFYIANKDETVKQVENAEYLYNKVNEYINKLGHIICE
ncbi:MAG: HEPN domain-containing protein [Lachnospira sp.]